MKEATIYYVAVIEVDPKWEKNNEGEVNLKNALYEKIEWGIGFRGEILKSVLLEDISKIKGLGRKTKGEL